MAPWNRPGTGPVSVVTIPRSMSDAVIPGPLAGPLQTEGDTLKPGIDPEPPADDGLLTGATVVGDAEPPPEVTELPDVVAVAVGATVVVVPSETPTTGVVVA